MGKELENYLCDLGLFIQEKAFDAKKRSRNGDPFEIGQLMAWHEIVSLMQSQAEVFGINKSQIGLEGIDPERDLL